MGDRDEEEELQMALRMSLHGSPPAQPEPKRSKPPGESPEAESRRKQRELMAAAAEKRLRSIPLRATVVLPPPTVGAEQTSAPEDAKEDVMVEPESTVVPMEDVQEAEVAVEVEVEEEKEGEELPPDVAEKLWVMVFGIGVSKAVLAQWSNQGIR